MSLSRCCSARALGLLLSISFWLCAPVCFAQTMSAGAAKVDVTHPTALPIHDPLHARALVLKQNETTLVIVSIDVVAIGEIGPIGSEYFGQVRSELETEFGLEPGHLLINASHCHGTVCEDVAARTIDAVRQAFASLEPVHVGSAVGHEDSIMENRRLRLADGTEADVRHAYSLPADAEVVGVGPIDPEIGVLRFDRLDGSTLAVIYNFACHPIQGVPGGGNTADLTGFSSQVIEENLGAETVALFVQGCAGDINPVFYKDVDHPRDAQILGNQLGLSTLRAVREAEPIAEERLAVEQRVIALPKRDVGPRIIELEAERERLVNSLRGTSLNLKSFMALSMKHGLAEEFPSYASHRYLHDDAIGHSDLRHLDAENRANMMAYLENIMTMEKLTRLQTNLALLKMHHEDYLEEGTRTVDAEVLGIRIGDSVWITFPAELTVPIGLKIKEASPHDKTFVAGYSNGYLYYAPTAEQGVNVGRAQEDSDCILGNEWEAIFLDTVEQLLERL